ncbi:MAG: FtsK/SpoIIIE domain-containing protein [Anaerostipes sp.]|jgi:hypothetical protein
MDKLLEKKAQHLPNERVELYAFIDRFIGTIEEYKESYENAAAKRDEELCQEQEDLQKNLQNTEAEFRNESEKNQQKVEASLKEYQQKITCESEDAKKNCATSEKEYRCKEEKLNREMLLMVESSKRNLVSSRMVVIELKNLYGQLRKLMTSSYKLDKIAEKQKGTYVVRTLDEAEAALHTHRMLELEKIVQRYMGISESIIASALLTSEKKNLLKETVKIMQSAESALEWLEISVVEGEQKAKVEQEEKLQNAKKLCNQAKNIYTNNCDQAIKETNKKIEALKKRDQEIAVYNKNLYEKKKRKIEQHYAEAEEELKIRWNQTLENLANAFVSQMECEYPQERVNERIKRFWDYPKKVKEYSEGVHAEYNTLIGEGILDISGLYEGVSGEIVRRVLENYYMLFGTTKEDALFRYRRGEFFLPYTVSIEEKTAIYFSYETEDERAKKVLNAIGMRMMRSVPACEMRFLLVDADGIGAFDKLRSLDPSNLNNQNEPLVKSLAIGETSPVHAEKDDILVQIREVNLIMEQLHDSLSSYGSVRAFNEKNSKSKQIYRTILIMNYPEGMEEGSMRKLNVLMKDCSSFGISTIVAQPDRALNSVKPDLIKEIQKFGKQAVCMRMKDGAKTISLQNCPSQSENLLQLQLYGVPVEGDMDEIEKDIRSKSVKASERVFEFADSKEICPEKKDRFGKSSTGGINIPVGIMDDGKVMKLLIDDSHAHTMIYGGTGAGKSNLLHAIMTSIMLHYKPEEVSMYLIDYKHGLDFRVYTRYNLPNFDLISLSGDPEMVLAILEGIEEENESRSEKMGTRNDIAEYNHDYPEDRLNRIVVIVDELYVLIQNAKEDVRTEILRIIDNKVHQDRAFGIHLIIGGQDLDSISKFVDIASQCKTKISFSADEDKAKKLIGENGVEMLHTIDANEPGRCVITTNGGKSYEAAKVVKVGRDHKEILKEIHNHYYDEVKQVANTKILYTSVYNNPNHPFSIYTSTGTIVDEFDGTLFVGEEIAIDRTLKICPEEHVWIMGGNANKESRNAGQSIMVHSLISLLLTKLKGTNIDIHCTNCSDYDGRRRDDQKDDIFSQIAPYCSRLCSYGCGTEFKSTLNEILDELEKRTLEGNTCRTPIWWFVLRPEMYGDSLQDIDVAMGLKKLLENGGKYGIHLVVWNADIYTAKSYQLSTKLFKDRFCLEMTSEEMKQLELPELKTAPEDYKVCGFLHGNVIRFRAYDVPTGKWIDQLKGQLMKAEV